MFNKKVDDFIKNNINEFDFDKYTLFYTGNVDNNKITKIENTLNIKLPKDYINFLLKYGMIFAFGFNILGCGKSNTFPVIKTTLSYRNLGLPQEYVVIENCDEYVYCIKCSLNQTLQSSVYFWMPDGLEPQLKEVDFWKYIYKRLLESKENFDNLNDDEE